MNGQDTMDLSRAAYPFQEEALLAWSGGASVSHAPAPRWYTLTRIAPGGRQPYLSSPSRNRRISSTSVTTSIP